MWRRGGGGPTNIAEATVCPSFLRPSVFAERLREKEAFHKRISFDSPSVRSHFRIRAYTCHVNLNLKVSSLARSKSNTSWRVSTSVS